MADKKMNEFQQVADAEYVYVEAADGSQVKIKKSDLFSSIFQYRGLASSHDFNDNDISGSYQTGDFSRNAANNPGVGYGVLVCMDVGSYLLQFSFDMFEKKMYYRMRTNLNEWKNWYYVSFT